MAAQNSSSDSAELSMEISSGSVIEGMVGRPGASSASRSSVSGVAGVKKGRETQAHLCKGVVCASRRDFRAGVAPTGFHGSGFFGGCFGDSAGSA